MNLQFMKKLGVPVIDEDDNKKGNGRKRKLSQYKYQSDLINRGNFQYFGYLWIGSHM